MGALIQERTDELTKLLERYERERVSPKLEVFRQHKRIKVAYGGRGAGAKTWSFESLLVQRAQKEEIKILCTREIQLSIEESVHEGIEQTIERLQYPRWKVRKNHIYSPSGAYFAFRGMHDMKAAKAVKGYEGFDIFWAEEAAGFSDNSWSILLPTVRKPGSELWVSFNREEENDPVYDRFVRNPREDSFVVWLEPGPVDNPWWTEELEAEKVEDYRRDPDEAEHVWGGAPRSQNARSVMGRTAIRGAMDRRIKDDGRVFVGVDVARFGDDFTELYSRKGLKTKEHREFKGQDTMKTAKDAWDMAGHDPRVEIRVDDTGVGGGVTDKLRELGANAIGVDFGGLPADTDMYTTAADEMWFDFPINEAEIPDDPELMRQLSGRRYDYDTRGRKKIESKKDYKKRNQKSPDKADSLLLCYYRGGTVLFDKSIRDGMAKRKVQRY